jgi:uncharacterized protein with PhoU and TrkA domain
MGKVLQKVMKQEKGVKDLLIEMKDLSELAIDLAYSALLFNSKEIALEVKEIEEQIDEKRLQIEVRTILSCAGPKAIDTMIGALRVASFIDKVSDAAHSIADLVIKQETKVGPFINEVFKETDETIARLEIKKTSELVGKTIDRIEEDTAAVIIAIKRKAKWTYNPGPLFKINSKDVIISVGLRDEIKDLQKMNS